jgi:hypothetical protein
VLSHIQWRRNGYAMDAAASGDGKELNTCPSHHAIKLLDTCFCSSRDVRGGIPAPHRARLNDVWPYLTHLDA